MAEFVSTHDDTDNFYILYLFDVEATDHIFL